MARRYRHIREFERMLADEGTTIVKVFLHICKRRATPAPARPGSTTPEKNWKFRAADLDDRARWDDFLHAYEDAISETSTAWAPWYVVPGDRKWVRNVAVSQLLVDTLRRWTRKYPPPEPGLEKLRVE